MKPLIDENKLKFDEKEQQKLKSLKNVWKCISKTLRLKAINWLIDSGNIINSILNYKPRRLVSNLRLPKEQKQAKQQIQEKYWPRK